MAPKPKKKTEEVAIIPSEIGTIDLASVMKSEAEKRTLITQYISQHMKSGIDYGTIKFGTKESKPSLFKPGSEKFLSLFKLTARFEKDTDTWEMAGSESGVFAYKCQLVASNGNVVGEGRGVAKLSEKQGWTINNAVKIAEKRAQIDAVLRTGALSDFFTQDLEDMMQTYDTTPIKENAVPVVSYDDHEDVIPTKKPSNTGTLAGDNSAPWRKSDPTLALRDKIKKLADNIVMVPLDTDEYPKWIMEITGLNVKDRSISNLEAIVERLEALS